MHIVIVLFQRHHLAWHFWLPYRVTGQEQTRRMSFLLPTKRSLSGNWTIAARFYFPAANTGRVIWQTKSLARFIEFRRSFDSRWVAVCERQNRLAAPMRAFAVSRQSVKEISLPPELSSRPARFRLFGHQTAGRKAAQQRACSVCRHRRKKSWATRSWRWVTTTLRNALLFATRGTPIEG
jgi:hypothetical protein